MSKMGRSRSSSSAPEGLQLQQTSNMNDEKEKKEEGSVPLLRLFAFADRFDYLLLCIGTLGAIVHGASMPIFLLFFGNVINGFGSNINNPSKTAVEVNKVKELLHILLVGS